MTLSMGVHVALTVARADERAREKGAADLGIDELIALTLPEIRRLMIALVELVAPRRHRGRRGRRGLRPIMKAVHWSLWQTPPSEKSTGQPLCSTWLPGPLDPWTPGSLDP
jgi:hypothetical protein